MAYDAKAAAERWRKDWAFHDACMDHERARIADYGCEDCGNGWDLDFGPTQDGFDDYGLLICHACTEKRQERDYLNSAEGRADRRYDQWGREP